MKAKIQAAKRLADSLVSEIDFKIWLLGHNNENAALDKLLFDIENVPKIKRDISPYEEQQVKSILR